MATSIRKGEDASGFMVFPEVFPAVDMAHFVPPSRRTRAGTRHMLSDPFVAEMARDPRLARIAGMFVGPDAAPFRATYFDKSAGSNWLIAWHQDTVLPLARRFDLPGWGPWSRKGGILYAAAPAAVLESVIALRIHLDDSGPENGPLRVLPGTHRLGVLSGSQICKLAAEIMPVECRGPAGSVTAMRPLNFHASSKSVTGRPRRVLHMEYVRPVNLPDGVELAFA